MSFLPDVIMLGQFPLATVALTGLAGGLVAYLLAGWAARRQGAAPGGAQDVVLNLLVGSLLGAKLIYVILDLPGYLANPVTLILFPYGPLALPAGAVGGAAGVALGLWRRPRPDRVAALDAAAVPLLLGLAVALLGWKEPGSWSFAPLMALAGGLAWWTGPGRRLGGAVVLGACALVVADVTRPVAGLGGGVTLLQIIAALVGTGAWLWTRKDPDAPS